MGRPCGHRTARAGGGHRRRPDDHLGVRGHRRRRGRRDGRHAHHRVRPPSCAHSAHRSWSGGSPIPRRRTRPRRGAWAPPGRPATSRRSGTSSSSWWPPAPPMRRPSGPSTPRKAAARSGPASIRDRAARTGSPPTATSPSAGPEDPGGLTTAFGSWYSTFSTYGKPLLISNTGVAPGLQSQFLRQVGSDLPSRYPLVKGLVYFDAPQEATQAQLALDGDGQAALPGTVTGALLPAGPVPVGHDHHGPRDPRHGGSASVDHRDRWTFPTTGAVSPTSATVPRWPAARTYRSPARWAVTRRRCPWGPTASSPPTAGTPPSSPRTPPPSPWSWCPRRRDGTGPASPATSAPRVQAGPGPAAMSARSGRPPPPHPGRCTSRSCPVPARPTWVPRSIPSGTTESAALAALNQGGGRPVSIVQLDQTWNAPFNATQLGQVFATGAIPMITWSCGDSDLKVANGTTTSPSPPMRERWRPPGSRYCSAGSPTPAPVPSDSSKCLGKAGATGYVQAYRDIVRQFRSAGAGNVGIRVVGRHQQSAEPGHAVELPTTPAAASSTGSAPTGSTRPRARRPRTGSRTRFGAWYSEFASSGKPLMISDTGAIAGPNHSLQATYLTPPRVGAAIGVPSGQGGHL